MNTNDLPAGCYTIRDGQYVPAKDGDPVALLIGPDLFGKPGREPVCVGGMARFEESVMRWGEK